jgi:excisionase family DNA binding protein
VTAHDSKAGDGNQSRSIESGLWLLPDDGVGRSPSERGNGLRQDHLPRRAEILALRDAGFTYASIGRHYDISRERVRQIVTVKALRPKPDLRSKPTLTPAEVARLLGVHTGTVRKWANRGLLRSFRVGSRRDRRFRREDIVSFMNGEESASTSAVAHDTR